MLSTANKKLKKVFIKHGLKVMSFGLNAIETCPFRGVCAKGCYATRGAYKWSGVRKKRDNNLRYTKLDDFIQRMNHYIDKARPSKRSKFKQLVIRIHDSGDFYSREYAEKWIEIAEQNKDVHFYAYTKSVLYFKHDYNRLPSNLRIIFSFGGKLDNEIDTLTHFHCHIFPNKESLENAPIGYSDASDNDMIAAFTNNSHIGIVYHGYGTKQWATN